MRIIKDMAGNKRTRTKKPQAPTVACPANPHEFLLQVMQGRPIPHVSKKEIMTPAGRVLREEIVVEDYYPSIQERFEAARILSRVIPPPPSMMTTDEELQSEQKDAAQKAKVLLMDLAKKKAEK